MADGILWLALWQASKHPIGAVIVAGLAAIVAWLMLRLLARAGRRGLALARIGWSYADDSSIHRVTHDTTTHD